MKLLLTTLTLLICTTLFSQLEFTSIESLDDGCTFYISTPLEIKNAKGEVSGTIQIQKNFKGKTIIRLSGPEFIGCADRGETITVKFQDGESLQFYSRNSWNCSASVILCMQGVGINNRQREMLMNKPISKISFSTMGKTVFLRMDESQDRIFRNALSFLMDE